MLLQILKTDNYEALYQDNALVAVSAGSLSPVDIMAATYGILPDNIAKTVLSGDESDAIESAGFPADFPG